MTFHLVSPPSFALCLVLALTCLAPLPGAAQAPPAGQSVSNSETAAGGSAEERAAEKKARKAQAKAERRAKAEAARLREAQAAAEAKASRAQARLARKEQAMQAEQAAQSARAAKTAKTDKAAPAAATVGGSRAELKSQANQMAAGINAAEAAMPPAELAIAERVHTGVMPCELGAMITLESDPAMPGYFNMSGKNFRYRMHPVLSSTGAIRLEDRQAGGVWLQLSNKSMLMNQKVGRRMADDCMSPAQASHAMHLKDNPSPSLLDIDGPAAATAPAAATPRKARPARPAP